MLSPYGGRVHAAWGLALSARIREEYGLESDAIWSDDGIIVHLPDADEPPGAELVLLDPDELEDLVVGELGGSALFGARFRENAGRALLIPRAYPGRRTPLWQQRLKSQTLLEVAKRYGQFPIVLETYRECLRDVLDVPGLQDLLRKLHSRELSVVEVETPTASPFASSLLFDYVATYMYEGDTPNAERRAAALALDRELLRELLGQEELRDLIDPGALEQVEADLQRRSERTRADSADALHDVLRRVGDLTRDELAQRAAPGAPLGALAGGAARASAGPSRCASPASRAGSPPRTRGCSATRWAPCRRAGCPSAFLADVPDALERLARRWARTHGPFEARELRDRYGLDLTPVLAGLERAGELVRGELRPGGSDARVVRPRGAAAPAARLAGRAAGGDRAGRPARARALPAQLAGRGPPPAVRRGHRPAARGARPAAGAGARPRGVGARRAAAPRRRLLAVVARPAVRRGRGRVGRRRAARAAQRQGRALLPRGRGGARARPRRRAAGTRSRSARTRPIRARLERGACFFTDLLVDVAGIPGEELQEALWDLVWAGEVTNDAFAPLRSPRRCARNGARARGPSAPRRGGGASAPAAAARSRRSRAAGRSPRRCSPRARPTPPGAGARRPSCCSSATGS